MTSLLAPTASNRRRLLAVLAFVCASVSIVALLLHVAGWLPLYFLVDVLGAPSLVLLLIVGASAYRIEEHTLVSRLVTGTWASLAATAAYDLTRLLLVVTGLIGFDPFLTHPIFGRLITGYPEETTVAVVVGWAYHFWNGWGLGLMYTLVAGPAHWLHALGWGLILEVAWLTALPSAFQLGLSPEVLMASGVGHAVYGTVLGQLSQRYVAVVSE